MKNIRLLGRTVPIAFMLIAILVVGVASGALVNYLSNTVTKPVAVSSPIDISGEITYWPGEQTYRLQSTGTGDAHWTNEEKHSGEWSVFLGALGDPGCTNAARVVVPYGDTLNSITDISFMFNLKTSNLAPIPAQHWADGVGRDGYEGPYIILEIDRNGDGAISYPEDDWVVLIDYGEDHLDTWIQRSISEGFHTDIGTTPPTTGLSLWHSVTTDIAWAPYFGHRPCGTLDQWKTLLGDKIVMNIKIAVGEWTFPFMTEAYIDDVVINGTPHDLEPIIEIYTFDGEPSFNFYAGDRFSATVDAFNHANQPIPFDIAVVLEGPEYSWTYIIDGEEELNGYGWFASGIYEVYIEPLTPWIDGVYVTADGSYTLATVHEGEIGPGSGYSTGFEMNVNPALTPDNYVFHILAITPIGEVWDWYMQQNDFDDVLAMKAYIDDVIARLPP